MEEDLSIVEVGLLEEYASTVAESPLCVAEIGSVSLHNLTLLREFFYERTSLHIVHVSFDFCINASFDRRFHFFDGGHFRVVVLGVHTQEYEVLLRVGSKLLNHSIHCFSIDHGSNHFVGVEFVFYAGDTLLFQEMAHVL